LQRYPAGARREHLVTQRAVLDHMPVFPNGFRIVIVHKGGRG
jgi:hypothetical protein